MGRRLTTGEIELARAIYKTSIDYSRVRIHDRKFFFGQPSNSGMTPNGEIYVDGAYSEDYSRSTVGLQEFFIHEMAHVWQYQNKVLNPIMAAIGEMFEHLFDYGESYKYTLSTGKDLIEYDIEQQAAIIADYFLTTKGYPPTYIRNHMQNRGTKEEKIVLLKQVLKNFIANPSYAKRKIECKWMSRAFRKQRVRKCNRVLAK